MKRLLFRLTAMLCILSLLVLPGLGAEVRTYELRDLGLSLEAPEEYITLTREIQDGDEDQAAAALSAAQIISMLEGKDQYLSLMDGDVTFEMTLTAHPEDAGDYAAMDDEALEAALDRRAREIETQGRTVASTGVLMGDQTRFLRVDSAGEGTRDRINFYTIYNGMEIALELRAFPAAGGVSDDLSAAAAGIVGSIRFDAEPVTGPQTTLSGELGTPASSGESGEAPTPAPTPRATPSSGGEGYVVPGQSSSEASPAPAPVPPAATGEVATPPPAGVFTDPGYGPGEENPGGSPGPGSFARPDGTDAAQTAEAAPETEGEAPDAPAPAPEAGETSGPAATGEWNEVEGGGSTSAAGRNTGLITLIGLVLCLALQPGAMALYRFGLRGQPETGKRALYIALGDGIPALILCGALALALGAHPALLLVPVVLIPAVWKILLKS